MIYPCLGIVGEPASQEQGAEVCYRAAADSAEVACVLSRGWWEALQSVSRHFS